LAAELAKTLRSVGHLVQPNARITSDGLFQNDAGDTDDDQSNSGEEDEDFEEGDKFEEEEDDDEETLEKRAKIRQFTSEIKALESAIERKKSGPQPLNPIMMVCFPPNLYIPQTLTNLSETIRRDIGGHERGCRDKDYVETGLD
jgi:TATA-binding protein-associated factor Taf7